MALRLFVADDSVTIHKVIELAFAGGDTVIESVTDGNSALDVILTFRPDVVLVDVCMTGRSGYEICAQVKQHPDLSNIPVILLAGTFEPFDKSEASRVGYNTHLTKPFDTSELIDVVQNLVGRNSMLQKKEPEPTIRSGEMQELPDAAVLNDKVENTRIPVSKQSVASFLGSNRVLDLFDKETAGNSELGLETSPASFESVPKDIPSSPEALVISAEQVSEELLDKIAERVVKKMSVDVISEIAWEIVPELSEILIKRSIEENQNS